MAIDSAWDRLEAEVKKRMEQIQVDAVADDDDMVARFKLLELD